MSTDSKLIATGTEWNFDHIRQLDEACAKHARKYGLQTFPNQIEVITSEQMLDAYSSVGLPVSYHHWSFGKDFLANEQAYKKGRQGLAYEIVINSNPCISYLMEGNSLAMQALVIAHACYGHNAFFKNNYLFRQWTQPDAIIDYMVFARNYIAECEERYGYEVVEATLDALHALRDHGVDRYKRPGKLDSMKERKEQAKRLAVAREAMRQSEYASLVPSLQAANTPVSGRNFPEHPEENLLYFIEKHAPKLEPWQRELCRIVRKIAQYFYPQRQTKVGNEGFATATHHLLLGEMFDAGEIDEGIYLEALHSHTNVVLQRPYSSLNPYAVGFAMFSDIRRICTKPTEEDRRWFPELVGRDWVEVWHDAVANYRDESFILQFMSPRVMRDLRLMGIVTDEDKEYWEVKEVASDDDFRRLRSRLADQHRLENFLPDISVVRYRRESDRALMLRHTMNKDKLLDESKASDVLQHLKFLWHYPVTLESVSENGAAVKRYSA